MRVLDGREMTVWWDSRYLVHATVRGPGSRVTSFLAGGFYELASKIRKADQKAAEESS